MHSTEQYCPACGEYTAYMAALKALPRIADALERLASYYAGPPKR